jgi:N-acetylglucosaminyldiphosphoundecaprenol N-acetyl-beta-D-mannosaminyltransferase
VAVSTDVVDVLGRPVDTRNAAAIRKCLRDFLGADDGVCRHVVTLNPEYLMAARRNPHFAAAIDRADIVVADGVGITLAVRLLRGARIERVTGVEVVEWLAAESGSADAPLFLLGAGPGVAERAAGRLVERFPGARIAGWWADGSPDPALDVVTVGRIAESRARVVAVAYGAPGQVTWIDRNRPLLAAAGVRVAIGVGGSLDYLSEAVARAPGPVRRLGLEWAFRLIREPWRWRRQTVLPWFVGLVAIEKAKRAIRRA